ncbi:MAG: hypothetical protein HY302_16975 [Opitutae bacterium]|nr:hypothetical protein [Opitutae bacterium]
MTRALLLLVSLGLAAGCVDRSQTGAYGITPVYLQVKLGKPWRVIERGPETGFVYVARGKTRTFWFADNRLVRTERQGQVRPETKKLLEEFEALASELQAGAPKRS